MEGEVEVPFEQSNDEDYNNSENHTGEVGDKNDDEVADGSKCWESESQYLLDSQQLVEGLSLCDEFLQSQSPNRDVQEKNQELNCKPRLSDYARLGPEDFKKDLAECQELVLDPANIELDTPPDFRLSQLVSFIASLLQYSICTPHLRLCYFLSLVLIRFSNTCTGVWVTGKLYSLGREHNREQVINQTHHCKGLPVRRSEDLIVCNNFIWYE